MFERFLLFSSIDRAICRLRQPLLPASNIASGAHGRVCFGGPGLHASAGPGPGSC
ncbi:hypothetical protein XHV734_4147 [Xanthomonas hortorum pv. vitians]|nr:hypothetical protein XHV734_4147 [Xanthomonas hortorum pv. vitians]